MKERAMKSPAPQNHDRSTVRIHDGSIKRAPARFILCILKSAVIYGGYPALLLGGAWVTWVMMSAHFGHLYSVTGVSATVGLILWGCERWIPYSDRWRVSPRESALDLSHLLLSTGLTSILVNATILGALVWAGSKLSGVVGADLWPTSWPLVCQVGLGLILGELGAYWVHRLCHLSELGWRIHALHHSAEKLHVWAAGRNHPLNVVGTVTLQAALPVLCGATPETLTLISTITGINGLLQHANVDLRPDRIMNLIFSTSTLHRWHHARDLDASNTNFGNNLIIWDRVFGTYRLPKLPPSAEVGVEGLVLPHSLKAHLALPFSYQSRQASPAEVGSFTEHSSPSLTTSGAAPLSEEASPSPEADEAILTDSERYA